MDPVSPGDCPLLLVGFAQLWGRPLSAGPANWYSPDMSTTFEQRLPVTVSLIVIEYLPVNTQFADEALRFPWWRKEGRETQPQRPIDGQIPLWSR